MTKKVYKVCNVRVRKLTRIKQKNLEKAVEIQREIRDILIVLIQDPANLMANTMNMIKKLEKQIDEIEYELKCREMKGEQENE